MLDVLRVGQLAPNFTATAIIDQDFVTLNLESYRGQYVVLLFYPLDFTFVCPTEINAFSDRYAEFKALGANILGISVDSEFSHLAWIQTERKFGGVGDINFPLVSDLKKEICQAYQILEPDSGIALRGLFIIDPDGILQYFTVHNLSYGRSVNETLRVLKAIRYVQSNPDEVCPVEWQEGDKTMVPDPEQAKQYFGANSGDGVEQE